MNEAGTHTSRRFSRVKNVHSSWPLVPTAAAVLGEGGGNAARRRRRSRWARLSAARARAAVIAGRRTARRAARRRPRRHRYTRLAAPCGLTGHRLLGHQPAGWSSVKVMAALATCMSTMTAQHSAGRAAAAPRLGNRGRPQIATVAGAGPVSDAMKGSGPTFHTWTHATLHRMLATSSRTPGPGMSRLVGHQGRADCESAGHDQVGGEYRRAESGPSATAPPRRTRQRRR